MGLSPSGQRRHANGYGSGTAAGCCDGFLIARWLREGLLTYWQVGWRTMATTPMSLPLSGNDAAADDRGRRWRVSGVAAPCSRGDPDDCYENPT